MICSKTSLVAFLALCGHASSFVPQAHSSPRVPSLLYYVTDPASTGQPNGVPLKTEAPSRQRRTRRRNSNKVPPASTKSRFGLHSQRVSELSEHSTLEQVMTAIKRAQNMHDSHDILVIGDFLLNGVDDHFAYGYKGSLLARFAVAALRLDEYDIASEAMRVRRERFSLSMEPFESAAIVRGLLRLHRTDEALGVIEDELPVIEGDGERLKHRASALATVASRNFFENEPSVALGACRALAELGPVVSRAGLRAEDIEMPWFRILAGADQCQAQENHQGRRYDDVVVGAMREFPLDAEVQEAFDRLA